jgi:hypothetical protein
MIVYNFVFHLCSDFDSLTDSFESCQDAEALSPLGVIWTTTGSGKPFVVARAPADGDRTRVFVIAATSRLWHLSPVENAEMDMWIDAFEAARKQK